MVLELSQLKSKDKNFESKNLERKVSTYSLDSRLKKSTFKMNSTAVLSHKLLDTLQCLETTLKRSSPLSLVTKPVDYSETIDDNQAWLLLKQKQLSPKCANLWKLAKLRSLQVTLRNKTLTDILSAQWMNIKGFMTVQSLRSPRCKNRKFRLTLPIQIYQS